MLVTVQIQSDGSSKRENFVLIYGIKAVTARVWFVLCDTDLFFGGFLGRGSKS